MLTDEDKAWLLETFATRGELERLEQRVERNRKALSELDLEARTMRNTVKEVQTKLGKIELQTDD